MWWLQHNFETKRANLERRAVTMRTIRDFFDGAGFMAVETPILQAMPTADVHIHGFATPLHDIGFAPLRTLYLHTSPEFAMKKLLVAGMEKIYQICPVFRNGEDTPLHSPEFTMIEWYRAFADYTDIMQDCQDLLRSVCVALDIKKFKYKTCVCDPFQPWRKLSVAQAFREYAGINLLPCLNDTAYFAQMVTQSGIRIADDDAWDDLFFRVMAAKIEPCLGMGVPTILYDYPVAMGALARRKESDPRWAERFELYVCGIELANAFSELIDAQEQRARFVADMQEKQRIYNYSYAPDEDFLKALEHGLPPCAGIALGIDRLVMLACGAADIDDVLWTGKP